MSLIFQAVPQQLNSETPVSGSWKFLAGTTSTNTIRDSGGTLISFTANTTGYNTHENNVVTYNNNLVIALQDNQNTKVLIAKRTSSGSWTLLGGDSGVASGVTHTLNGQPVTVSRRQFHGLTVFQGELYLCISEWVTTYVNSNGVRYESNYGYIVKWNEQTASWVNVTTGTRGIHEGFVNPLPTSTLTDIQIESGKFCKLNNELYYIFDESYSTYRSLVSQRDYNLVARKIAPTLGSRQISTVGGAQISRGLGVTGITHNNSFYIFDSGYHSNNSYKFDGSQFFQIANLDNNDPGYVEYAYANGISFQSYNGKIILMLNRGTGSNFYPFTNFLIYESVDGQGFTNVLSTAMPTNRRTCAGAQYINNQLFLAAENTITSSPHLIEVFYRSGNSWVSIGGGTPQTNVNAYFSLTAAPGDYKNLPLIVFYQGPSYNPNNTNFQSDGRLYIARAKP